MQTPGEVLQEVAEALTTAGLPASTEVSELVPFPGAWIVPGTMNFVYLSNEEYDFDIEVLILTPNQGAVESFNSLMELLTIARSVYHIPTAEPFSLSLGNGQEPLPGLSITITLTITKD